jgi:hypothetical protein
VAFFRIDFFIDFRRRVDFIFFIFRMGFMRLCIAISWMSLCALEKLGLLLIRLMLVRNIAFLFMVERNSANIACESAHMTLPGELTSEAVK